MPNAPLVLDLETVAQDAHAERIMTTPFDLAAFAPKNNAKNPDVIARQLEEAAAEHEAGKLQRIDALALSPRTGRIVVAGFTVGDAPNTFVAVAEPDERSLLECVWNIIAGAAPLIGFNSFAFDVPFVLNRSALLGVRPSLPPNRIAGLLRRYAFDRHFDVRMALTAWDMRGPGTKSEWAEAFGLDRQPSDGSSVGQQHRDGRHDLIVAHCNADVSDTLHMYNALRHFYLA